MSRAWGASTFIWASPFTDAELPLIEHVAVIGFDVVEVCLEQPELLTASKVGAAATLADIRVSACGAFGPTRDASSDDPAVRRATMDYLLRCVDFAAEVGSPHVAGPMYAATGVARMRPATERAAQRQRAAELLHEVAEYAAAQGIALAIEPLNRYETDLVNTVDQALALCDLIDADNVGLMLDTYHLNIEERSIGAAIVAAGERCLHVQASENDRGTPGAGHIPWREVFDALDRIDYNGSIVIESFTDAVAEIASAVSMWRPVADSPDALAIDGLAFLRSLGGAS